MLGGLGLEGRLLAGPRGDVDLFARFDAEDIAYAADGSPRASGSSGSALALLASAGVAAGWVVVPSLRVSAEIGASAPVRPVRATEGDTPLVGVSGVGALAGVGVGGLF